MGKTQRVADFSRLEIMSDFSTFCELLMENDVNGNPIYIGYNRTPNAGQSVPTWFIVKITYDANQSPTHQQLPNQGAQFVYSWTNRATYF